MTRRVQFCSVHKTCNKRTFQGLFTCKRPAQDSLKIVLRCSFKHKKIRLVNWLTGHCAMSSLWSYTVWIFDRWLNLYPVEYSKWIYGRSHAWTAEKNTWRYDWSSQLYTTESCNDQSHVFLLVEYCLESVKSTPAEGAIQKISWSDCKCLLIFLLPACPA